MKHTLLIVLFLSVGFSQKLTEVVETYVDDKDGKWDGLITEWYENGQKSYEATYKDGEQDGLATWWYENGHKKEEGSWNKNGKVGEWFEWYENATLQKSEIYKEGEKDGRFTYYDKNGKMISDGYYGDGKRYTMYKDDT